MKDFIFDLQRFDDERPEIHISGSGKNTLSFADVFGSAGSDTIENVNAYHVSISGGAGNDSIHSSNNLMEGSTLVSAFNTINGGLGDDTIGNIGGKHSYITDYYGNNYIYNSGEDSKVITGDGNDTVTVGYSFVTNPYNPLASMEVRAYRSLVESGAGNDSIRVTTGNLGTTIKAGADNDTVYSESEDNIIYGEDGDDSISSTAKSTVFGGDGADNIENYSYSGASISLLGGDGSDTITCKGSNKATIYGGKGNDVIKTDIVTSGYYTYDGRCLVFAEEGDDSIASRADNVTIYGGKGNDTISLIDGRVNYGYRVCSNYNVIRYANGDGNDIVYGFNADDTVQITSGSYSTVQSGKDLIIKVGSGSVTLKEVSAASIFTWTFKTVGSTVTATGKLNGKVVTTITGLKKGTKASDLSVNGSTVTVSKNALTSTQVKITGNYTLALADDVTKSELTKAAGWNISGTSATYQTASRTKGFILAANGKSISWNAGAVSKNLTTVTGLKEGVTANDLKLNGTNVILSPNALGTTPVKINNTYNLALSADVKKSTTTAARWNVSGTTATFTNAKVTEGYVLAANKKTVTYKTDSGGNVLATLTGLKAGTLPKHITLNAKNKTITLSKNALAANSTVSLDGDYSLVLGSDVAKTRNVAAHWEINGTTAKYIAAKTVGGYKVSSDKKSVSYTAASGGNVLATLTGLKKGVTAAQLAINGNVITLPKGALGTTKVTLTGNYSLALAANVAIPKVVADAKFVVNGTTANYLSTKISAGYTLAADKKSITYSAVKGGNAVATIGGLKQGVTADKFSVIERYHRIHIAEGVGGTNGLTVSGKDYEFRIIPPYKVTVNGTAGAVIGDYTTESGNRSETLIGGKGNDVLMANNGGPGAKYNYVSGGDGNDYLHGGIGYLSATLLGGNGNDTLDGNNGTDNVRIAPCTLTGGKGNDIFVYDGGGYITVTDYTAGQDKIQCGSNSEISNLINQATVSGNDVYLNKSVNPYTNNFKGVESCYLLKNAKGKKITFIDNNGNTTVKTFTASAALSSAALLAEDNFATADNLSAITENNLSSVGDFETQNFDSLTQENLITYADK